MIKLQFIFLLEQFLILYHGTTRTWLWFSDHVLIYLASYDTIQTQRMLLSSEFGVFDPPTIILSAQLDQQ